MERARRSLPELRLAVPRAPYAAVPPRRGRRGLLRAVLRWAAGERRAGATRARTVDDPAAPIRAVVDPRDIYLA